MLPSRHTDKSEFELKNCVAKSCTLHIFVALSRKSPATRSTYRIEVFAERNLQ